MNAIQPLYDWSPILYLLLVGLIIGLVPLIWLWTKNKNILPARRLQQLTLVIAFLTFDLIIFGAFTRLTDSGLGCPDWPGCYGSASPFGAIADISAQELADPLGPVTWFKAWVEMLHRYFASAIGFLIIILTLGCWYYRDQIKLSPWWATATLVWVLLQGAFGAWTVTMKLFPAIVTAHLLAGIFLLVLVRVQSIRYAQDYALSQGCSLYERLSSKLRWLIGITLLVLALQLALGGWVSTNYAVLACGAEFPTCSNSLGHPWWPEMNFNEGFQIWRELHSTQAGEAISLAALTAIQYSHRLLAYLVLVLMFVLAWQLRFTVKLRFWRNWLWILALLQLLTGASTVLFNRPLLFAVLHTAGATALVLVLVSLWCLSKPEPNNYLRAKSLN